MSDPKEYIYYLVYVTGKGFVGNHYNTFCPDPRDAYSFESRGFAEDTAMELGGELVTVRFTTTT